MSSSATASEVDIKAQIYALGSAIPLLAFQVCTAIVFSLAIISAFGRTVMRAVTRRPLYWDDFFLAVAVACLIATTGLLYQNVYYFYMLSAITKSPELGVQIPFDQLSYLLNSALPEESAAAGVAWTVIFCVKASFLIVSKQLIQRVSMIRTYFWAVAIFTGLSWATLVCSPFIQCPHFGFDSSKCSGPGSQTLYSAMNGLIAGLDILTDLLVASIPIIVLWRSQIDSKQKFIVGPFLSLSLVMIVFSAIRVSKTHSAEKVDIVWLAFWQYLEAGIAVTVTSITTIRTVFTARKARKSQTSHSKSYASATVGSKRPSRVLDTFGEEESHLMEPAPPSRIMVHETWGVSYSEGPHKSEDFETPIGRAA